MVEAIFSEVADIDIRPAVVVVIGDCHAHTPPVVSHTRLRCHISEGAIVIVVKQCGLWRGCLSAPGVEGRTIDEINIEPAIVVVVDQAHARTVRLDDKTLVWRAHRVLPNSQARFLCDVLKDGGTSLDEAPSGDRSMFTVENRRMRSPSVDSARLWLRGLTLRRLLLRVRRWRPRSRRLGNEEARTHGADGT